MIRFETKIYHEYQFYGEEYLLGLNFELKSHKTADFMKIVLEVCRLVRYREKQWKKEKNMSLQVPDIKENSDIDL